MATLKDVAKLANVDISTVSRALNNVSYVHPDTKKRIFDAVEELSYHPNVLAKGLREGKKRVIAIVVPRLSVAVYSDMIPSITETARKRDYECIICTTYDDEKIEKEILSRLRSGLVDGIIISATGKNNRLLRDINAQGICVLQAIRRQNENLSSIISNYYATGYDAVKFLYSKGCRNIGLIIGNLALHPYKERFNGYAKAMKELGLETIVAMDDADPNSFEYGLICTKKLLSSAPYLDGVLASVDIQGMGALRALKQEGKKIPQEIKLISLTGISIGQYLETSMTSMEIPASEIGEEAANLIIKDIESKSSHKAIKNLVFNATLEEREST